MKNPDYKRYLELVEMHMVDILPDVDPKSLTLYESMKYSLVAGGKRLRPCLLMGACEFAGGELQAALPYACAIEYVHTYSLIHDDLPCMDDDEYRRGRKTTWVVYGEGMAILAGDALLNYAYETALKAFDACKDARETGSVISAMKLLAANAGIYGMVGGQCADLEAEKKPEETGEEGLTYIHKHKTACMIESGFQIGAILAGAPKEDVDKLGKIAENIGIAFQIQDDILDVIGDSEELGKPVGSDSENGKSTYVSLLGIEKCRELVDELTEKAIKALDVFENDASSLREFALELAQRRK